MKLINLETKIVKEWEIYKLKILLNKILLMISSQAIKEMVKNWEDEFMSSKQKLVTDKLKLTSKSILWDKIWKAKNKPIKCSNQETNSFNNGHMNLKEILSNKESQMSTFSKIPTFPEDRLSKSDNRWEQN